MTIMLSLSWPNWQNDSTLGPVFIFLSLSLSALFRQGYHPLPLGSPELGVLLIPAVPGVTPTSQLDFVPLLQAYQNKRQILKAGYLLTYFYSFPLRSTSPNCSLSDSTRTKVQGEVCKVKGQCPWENGLVGGRLVMFCLL